MNRYLISYASKEFEGSQHRLELSALRFGLQPWQLRRYGPADLRGTAFFRENKDILRQRKGAGYWLWKPHVILRTLNEVADGDLVLYSDSGAELVHDPSPIFDLCVEVGGILLFSPKKFLCRWHTKRDCFFFMGCDSPRYHEATMALAGFNVFRKNEATLEFLNEWLRYCKQPEILTDQPNTCGQPNLPGFRQHRHDQSVLSMLVERERLHLFRDPCQYGNYLKPPQLREMDEALPELPYSSSPDHESLYPTLFHQHWERDRTIVERSRHVLGRLARAAHQRIEKAASRH